MHDSRQQQGANRRRARSNAGNGRPGRQRKLLTRGEAEETWKWPTTYFHVANAPLHGKAVDPVFGRLVGMAQRRLELGGLLQGLGLTDFVLNLAAELQRFLQLHHTNR